MNYEIGLDKLREIANGTEWYQDFLIYESSLRENLRDDRRYGPSEQSRRDRVRIVEQINILAIKYLNTSFNEFCTGSSQLTAASEKGVKDLASLIDRHKRRLQILKEQEAISGLSVDPKIPLEIEDIELRIAKLQDELIKNERQQL